jgi:hypothetical protein
MYRRVVIGRRIALKVLGATATATLIPVATTACGDDDETLRVSGPFFTTEERRALDALANVVIPSEEATPGGGDLGASTFIERLLTAFDTVPPSIYADGPYSGRQPQKEGGTPPPNDFVRFRPLDRVTEMAWRIQIYGSAKVPGGRMNEGLVPPVVGLRDLIRDNVRQAMRVAAPRSLETMSAAEVEEAFVNLPAEFRDAMIDLVPQAAFGAPEYGGNPDLRGWKMVGVEGDTQPLGYSIFDEATGTYHDRPGAPMVAPASGADPAPLDPETHSLLSQVISFTGGRKFGA